MKQTDEIPLMISGYADAPATGTATVRTYDRPGRLGRAAAGLATWWAVAAAGALIPVAHFLLVPGFGVFGIIVAIRRLRTERVTEVVRGTCPDCGHDQTFDVPDRWAPPFDVMCRQCGRGLKVKVDDGPN